jgi:hypothetical protein
MLDIINRQLTFFVLVTQIVNLLLLVRKVDKTIVERATLIEESNFEIVAFHQRAEHEYKQLKPYESMPIQNSLPA